MISNCTISKLTYDKQKRKKAGYLVTEIFKPLNQFQKCTKQGAENFSKDLRLLKNYMKKQDKESKKE